MKCYRYRISLDTLQENSQLHFKQNSAAFVRVSYIENLSCIKLTDRSQAFAPKRFRNKLLKKRSTIYTGCTALLSFNHLNKKQNKSRY